METNIVLVLVLGLPGSGKTTLCKSLKSYHKATENYGKLAFVHVCYDELIPLSTQKVFVEQKKKEKSEKYCKAELNDCDNSDKNESAEKWKSIDKNKSVKDDGNEGNVCSEDWKSARHKIRSEVEQLLHYINSRRVASGVEDFFGIPLESLERDKYVILLDDNFYYRSMRYEFFQLARTHSAAFCQLYLKCSLEEAIQNNSMREECVPIGAVTAMAVRLQPPQPHIHPWEANTHVLQGQVEVHLVWGAVLEAFKHGLTPIEDRVNEVAEARRRCSQSVVHQADLSLRAMVKHLIKVELQKTSHGEGCRQASKVAACINAARQAVLADLRGGTLEVLSHLSDAITDNNRQEFDAFLEEEIKRKISN